MDDYRIIDIILAILLIPLIWVLQANDILFHRDRLWIEGETKWFFELSLMFFLEIILYAQLAYLFFY